MRKSRIRSSRFHLAATKSCTAPTLQHRSQTNQLTTNIDEQNNVFPEFDTSWAPTAASERASSTSAPRSSRSTVSLDLFAASRPVSAASSSGASSAARFLRSETLRSDGTRNPDEERRADRNDVRSETEMRTSLRSLFGEVADECEEVLPGVRRRHGRGARRRLVVSRRWFSRQNFGSFGG